MHRKKLLAFMLTAATAVTAMPVGAFADTVTGDIREITEADLDENNQKDISIPVEYTVGASFTVKLPSAITLSNTDGSWGYSGTVGVKGDIDSGKSVKVKPSSSVTMYDVTNRPTEDVPSGAEDQAYDHKDAKNATVAQAKKQWTMTELSADTYSDTALTLSAGAMQSGKWKGLLNVDISYGEYVQEPGLYAAGGAFTPWDDLVSAGTVTMDGNVLKKCKSSVSGEMVIPDGVTSIGSFAFNGCRSLTSITIPDSVTSIENGAFQNCSGLTSITIPDGVTSIGSYVFSGCTGLTSITIPDSVTSIGSYVFSGCTGLTSITIQDGVTSIGDHAFYNCTSLESITVAEGNTKYDSRNNCNAIIEKATNKLIAGCKNTVIPDGVTSIGSYAFSGCTGLTSITIPDSVTSIGDGVFNGCTGLTDITFTGTQEQWSAITKGSSWNYNLPATVVHCTDGDVTL